MKKEYLIPNFKIELLEAKDIVLLSAPDPSGNHDTDDPWGGNQNRTSSYNNDIFYS